MFLLRPVLLALSLTPFVALAGQHNIPSRSRKHHRNVHYNITRNLAGREAPPAKAGPLSVVDKYEGKSFFEYATIQQIGLPLMQSDSGWGFFTEDDPTHGLVKYVSREEAFETGLASVSGDGVVTIGVDKNSTLPVGGSRKAVRISSQKTYNGGLFVMDVNAMPTGCATWPAFWTVGGNWPKNGEIDIVEGVNKQTNNQMTLHTAPGCTLDATAPGVNNMPAFVGKVLSTTCDATANSNSGCGVTDPNPKSFGAGVKSGGGAVFVMLWDSIGIRIWHFNRSNTPADLTAFAPDPSTWPSPSAFWSISTCPVDEFFKDHSIIINTTFCGDFAGNAYKSSGCPGTCAERVADAKNFEDGSADWEINYVAVYQ